MKRTGILIPGLYSLLCSAVWGHPLGNFSINRYTKIKVHPEQLEMIYLLDMAEIPSYQEILQIDENQDGTMDKAEREDYLQKTVPRILGGLYLEINRQRTPLSLIEKGLGFPEGEGGQLLVNVLLRAEVPFPKETPLWVRFRDETHADKLGQVAVLIEPDPGIRIEIDSGFHDMEDPERVTWSGDNLLVQQEEARFQIVHATPAVSMASETPPPDSYKPARDSDEIGVPLPEVSAVPTIQPPRMKPLAYAREVFSATLAKVKPPPAESGSPDGSMKPASLESEMRDVRPREEPAGPEDSITDRVARFIREGSLLSPTFLVIMVLAFVTGAFHSLKPGHGKTIAAAYLVGSRGTFLHAILLGAVVTLTHTGSILTLGVAILAAVRSTDQQKIQALIEGGMGLIIIVLGVTLFLKRYAGFVRLKTEEQNHDHGQTHGHTHEMPDRITPASLLTLGFAGGVVPCPGALLLLTAAMTVGRLDLGLILILVYSAGLGCALISIGLVTVYAKKILSQRVHEHRSKLRWLTILSPVAVTFFGLLIVFRALVTAGVVVIQL